MSSSRVHIGNIPEAVTDQELFNFLETAEIRPTIPSAHIVTSTRSGAKSVANTGRYIVLTFESDAVATHAIDHINNLTLTVDNKQYQLNATPFIPDFRVRKQNGTGNIIIHNLPQDIERISLKEAYSSFGRVLSSYVKSSAPLPIDSRKKASAAPAPAPGEEANVTKLGYVMFETDEEAEAAIQATDGKFLGKNQVHVQKYVPIAKRIANEKRVYLRGIRDGVTPEDLRARIEQELGPNSLLMPSKEAIKLRPDTRGGDLNLSWTVLECDTREHAERLVQLFSPDSQETPGDAIASFVAIYESRGIRALNAAMRLAAARKNYVESKRNVSVYNLRLDVTKEQLMQFFGQYGSIQSVGLPPKGTKGHQGDSDVKFFHANILFETVDAASAALNSAPADEAKLEERLAQEGLQLETKYYTQDRGQGRAEARRDASAIPFPASEMRSIYGAPGYYSVPPAPPYMLPQPGPYTAFPAIGQPMNPAI